jgi:hypothetical protein
MCGARLIMTNQSSSEVKKSPSEVKKSPSEVKKSRTKSKRIRAQTPVQLIYHIYNCQCAPSKSEPYELACSPTLTTDLTIKTP